MTTTPIRRPAAEHTLSGTALHELMQMESFTDHAIIPVKGDVPTIGYGSTKGVKLGDTITESEARARLKREIRDVYEAGIRAGAGDIPMTQGEYDSVILLAYNVGVSAVLHSTMLKLFRKGEYCDGCAQLRRWVFFQGKDCRKRENGCYGLVLRRDKEYAICMGEHNGAL